MTRTTSAIGRAVLEAREGVRLEAYKDSKGIWTIGVGHTAGAGAPIPKAGLKLTREEVDALFARDLAKYEATVNDCTKGVELADHEFDALVSLCYNVGQMGVAHSTIVRRLLAGDRKGAGDAFSMWEKDKILVPRREAERLQFLTPYATALPRRVMGEAPISAPAALKAVIAASAAPRAAVAPSAPKAANTGGIWAFFRSKFQGKPA